MGFSPLGIWEFSSPYSNQGGRRLYPPHYCLPTRIWKPSGISAMSTRRSRLCPPPFTAGPPRFWDRPPPLNYFIAYFPDSSGNRSFSLCGGDRITGKIHLQYNTLVLRNWSGQERSTNPLQVGHYIYVFAKKMIP